MHKNSLRTIDNVQNISLLPESDMIYKINLEDITKMTIGSNDIYIINKLFTKNECEKIITNSGKYHEINDYTIQNYGYDIKKRQSQRKCIIDFDLSTVIWNRIQIMHDKGYFMGYKPFGYLTEGIWIPIKINECYRLNIYNAPSIGFSPHYDGQYTESFNTKSIFTMIIYLNDEYEGGDTILYDKENKIDISGLTIDEEIKINNGINTYKQTIIKPAVGKCLIFPHNTIHASDKIIKGKKIIVKTDIVFECVKRKKIEFNKKEYLIAAEYFMKAQKLELANNIIKSCELYERCLSMRINVNKKQSDVGIFPKDIWLYILKFLDLFDAVCLIETCRIIHIYLNKCIKSMVNNYYDFVEKAINNNFYMYNKEMYYQNVTKFLKLSIIQTLINYETNYGFKNYIAQYIPETRRVLLCPKQWLYYCAFNEIPCYGQFFNFDMESNELNFKFNKYNNDEKINVEELFFARINPLYLNGLSNEYCLIEHSNNVSNINVCNCFKNKHISYKYRSCLDKHGFSKLIFDFSNNSINIEEQLVPCHNIYHKNIACYSITFPKKSFTHAGCVCNLNIVTDVEIKSIKKIIKTLQSMHICVHENKNDVIHQIRYISVNAL
jgi:hypothetical protein